MAAPEITLLPNHVHKHKRASPSAYSLLGHISSLRTIEPIRFSNSNEITVLSNTEDGIVFQGVNDSTVLR